MNINVSELAGQRIVVTGAAGFIGGHVLDRLAASGASWVGAVDLRPLPDHVAHLVDDRTVCFHQRNILDPLDHLLDGTDVVIHLAAEVSPPRSVRDPIVDAHANVMGTIALLEAMRRSKTRRLIYASSSAVYGTPRYVPVDEAHPTVPESPYGLSKLTGESYAHLYRRLHGLSVAALRFFNVYGPHQPLSGGYAGVITLFRDQVQRGVPLTIEGDGSNTRDFVHVEDIARAIVVAASSPFDGTVNIGSGTASSIAELAALIGGPAHPITYLPPRLGDIPHSVAAVDAARRELGFKTEITLAQGLARMT